MASLVLVSILISPIFVKGKTEVERFGFEKVNSTRLDHHMNAIGKAHFNTWNCNYKTEPGFKCINCSTALRCYPGDLALLVQCGGFLPHCRNGYCSRWKTAECNEDYMFAEGTHGPLRLTTVSNDRITMLSEENFPSGSTAAMPDENTLSAMTTERADSNKVEIIVTSTATVATEQNPTTGKKSR